MQKHGGHSGYLPSRRMDGVATSGSGAPGSREKNAVPDSDLLDLNQIFQILRRRARLIFGVAAAGLGLAIVYLLITKPAYTAAANVFIDTRQQKVFAADAVLPGLSSDASVIESQVEILRSPNIARRAIEVLGLYDPQADADAASSESKAPQTPEDQVEILRLPNIARKAIEVLGLNDPQADDAASSKSKAPQIPEDEAEALKARSAYITNFLANLEVTRMGLTYIIEVSFTDPDPLQAVNIANAVADAYIADQTEAKYEATRRANRWLNARIGELRNEVRTSEERVQVYKAEHNLIEIGDQNLTEREVAEYTQQLIAARAQTAEAEAQLQIDQNRSRITETSNNAYELARTKVILLEKGLEALKKELAQRNQLAIQLAELQREAEATSSLYSSLLKRHKETQAQESLQSPDVRIIAYALPPVAPSKPNKKFVFGLAGIASLGFGVLLALAIEFNQGVFRSPKDLARVPGLPWLATLPIIDLDKRQDGKPGTSQKSKHAGKTRLWHVIEQESSKYSQSIFSALHAIVAPELEGRPLVITVASADQNEGKTTVASNLAHYAASSGARTLLVDCDLRKPTLTVALSPNPPLSIADIVSGTADPSKVIVSIPRSGVDFCPGPHGKPIARPMNVTGSFQIVKFLQAMRDEYDLVILDTSPLLPFVDARPLIDQADFVLLIIEWGKTTRENIQKAFQEANLPGDKRIGVILNKATM